MEKMYRYSVCYQKLAISASLKSHILVIVLVILGIVGGKNYNTDFLQLMKNYDSKQLSKTLVDDVQLMFQCCGSENFNDWSKLNESNHKRIKR